MVKNCYETSKARVRLETGEEVDLIFINLEKEGRKLEGEALFAEKYFYSKIMITSVHEKKYEKYLGMVGRIIGPLGFTILDL